MDTSDIGIVFGSLTPPEELTQGAALAERLGFGELWFSEDCFFTGGLSGLTQLLAATRTVPAGLGLASVMTRHPAVLAMELSGLARMYPGRTRAAVGLGNTHWLRQMGLLPERPLTAVTETFDVLRELLSGATVDRRTSTHQFSGIRLEFPPEQPPELWIGAVNARALRAAGAIADGILLSVLAGPTYVSWAREQVSAAGRPTPPITAFVLAAVDDDERAARDAVREAVGFFLKAEAHTALIEHSRHGAEIRDRTAKLGENEPLVVEDAWIDEFAVAGRPGHVRERLQELLAAGADSLGLWLFPPDQLAGQLQQIARDALPETNRPTSGRHQLALHHPQTPRPRSDPSPRAGRSPPWARHHAGPSTTVASTAVASPGWPSGARTSITRPSPGGGRRARTWQIRDGEAAAPNPASAVSLYDHDPLLPPSGRRAGSTPVGARSHREGRNLISPGAFDSRCREASCGYCCSSRLPGAQVRPLHHNAHPSAREQAGRHGTSLDPERAEAGNVQDHHWRVRRNPLRLSTSRSFAIRRTSSRRAKGTAGRGTRTVLEPVASR
ncbi:LLM class flavin-dependent oxidoreductase [Nonomuraea sp. NN258]|uniref:LLM class flavin-dependent oxidoreductase n=1 Tax=Nonomuraea antri TaxID=2730852 RepID=UPI0015693023|nr:LLM class flavin-dependent oxidoreductase [Nonomuraea antri]NRQ32487.1 LLM class flavin-dependent oxidoreductase [Nonomuraea antri]